LVSFLAYSTGYSFLGTDYCGAAFAAFEPKPEKAFAIPEKNPLKALGLL